MTTEQKTMTNLNSNDPFSPSKLAELKDLALELTKDLDRRILLKPDDPALRELIHFRRQEIDNIVTPSLIRPTPHRIQRAIDRLVDLKKNPDSAGSHDIHRTSGLTK
jgi:hypothetical protein